MKGLNLIFDLLTGNEETAGNLKQVGNELKNYISLQKEYIKLVSTEKLIRFISAFVLGIILIAIGLAILFYLTIAFVVFIAPLVGGTINSLMITSALLLLLALMIYFLRKPLIERIITRTLIKTLYH